ncbi:class I SAM-dependent methyltransferase [Phyllobacterium sp. YR531]|uniref:class I SAM-dependent methyltransferase n=1 Tax=Phyllobacterium sp. YR531 TaxID=1144343 RepID=UPI00026FA187|nr:class I SAM-dependent methyltransferase [Phyllobacterium sp. YR531]EJN02230.1 putative O-methyltransferase [Phyllobacterium sp. YR531]
MSGFDIHWLDLREPVDGRARDWTLLEKAAQFVRKAKRQTIVDLGSGTGSTYRAIAPLIPDANWRLVDLDERLLEQAARRHQQKNNIIYQNADLNDLAFLGLREADLVSASALFDLCSNAFIERLADELSRHRIGLYAALNYNGKIMFDVPHPDDAAVVKLFNDHQRSDKGLGPALGPESSRALTALFTKIGYHVEVAQSDWRIDEDAVELHQIFVDGLASAVAETVMLARETIVNWLEFRIGKAGTGCVVGHCDILALPV